MKTITEIVPRYAETDQMGIIHHSVYPVWFEQGRTDFCRDIGYPFHEIEKLGVSLALVELHVEYKAPARYGDVLTLYTYVINMTQVKIEFGYELYHGEKLLTKGRTLLAWLGKDMKPISILKKHPDIYQAISATIDHEPNLR